jgi:hypothetical protein
MTTKKQKRIRYFAVFMILNLVFEIATPTVALALTNGQVQPEYVGFEPAGSSEMVDLFTGDFKYNIPIMDVDGYPLNLSYKAGVNMDAEASWVGLGWSLNPGALNRAVRGVPDDFNGDEMESETKMKPFANSAQGVSASWWSGFSASFGLFGLSLGGAVNTSYGTNELLTFDSYKGYGYDHDQNSNVTYSQIYPFTTLTKSTGYGIAYSSQNGASEWNNEGDGVSHGISTPVGGLGFSKFNSVSTNVNTRTGSINKTTSSSLSMYASVSLDIYGGKTSVGIGYGVTSAYTLPAGFVSYSPRIPFDYVGSGKSDVFKNGYWWIYG